MCCDQSFDDHDAHEGQISFEIRLGFWSELIDRADVGYQLCSLIVMAINASLSLGSREDIEKPDPELSAIVLNVDKGETYLSVRLHSRNGNLTPFYGELSVLEDSSADASELARFHRAVGPVARWENVKRLLQECFSTSHLHSHCGEYPSLELPPRGFRHR
jgi:hypothetical protein